MSYYKETIIKGIAELNERKGSSLPAIKKYVQSNIPKGKEYKNGVFLLAMKRAVESETLVKTKGSHKLSTEAEKASKKATAPKKAAPKKKAPAKKSLTKKKTTKEKNHSA